MVSYRFAHRNQARHGQCRSQLTPDARAAAMGEYVLIAFGWQLSAFAFQPIWPEQASSTARQFNPKAVKAFSVAAQRQSGVTGSMHNSISTPVKEGSAKAAPDWRLWTERLPVARNRPVLASLATLAIVALAWAARYVADPLLPPGFPYVTFFPAVIVTSFLFGIRLGSVSAFLCGLLAWYFFIPPHHSFVLTGATAFALCFYLFVVATDLALVHWMQIANRQLARERERSQSLAMTRELLFSELQHRVSNNLQVAAGLLSMQKRRLVDPDARAALDEASGRIALVGRISRQLYDPSGAAQPLLPFLGALCRDVVEASGRDDLLLTMQGDERLLLEPDAAVPTALIVAEAVANAIEHGFARERSGQIMITVAGDDANGLTVTIDDDGHGLAEGFDKDQGNSLGLKIATSLARGHGGGFAMESRGGTRAMLTLPPHLLTAR